MLDALKAASKKEAATTAATKVGPAKAKSPFEGGTKSKALFGGGGTKMKSSVGVETKPKKNRIIKKKKKSHNFEEGEPGICEELSGTICGSFLDCLGGIHSGCSTVVTCGICFDQYSEKQDIIVPEDEHDLKCQPDTKVMTWISILIIVVGIFAYIISISFEELPGYVRVEYFREDNCKKNTITHMEYVPIVTCLKWSGQSLNLKKRKLKLKEGESEDIVQSGRPPKKPQSVVYTFTEHYMWGLSWYADLYEKEGCLSATGIPDSIAKVESDESGKQVQPLYKKVQLLDVCLNRDEWEYESKSARLLGSRCLGNHRLNDILGMYDDPECKSLVKATAYNLTFYNEKKSPKNTEKWKKCTKSEVDQMYYKRVMVTPQCSSKYDIYGERILDNGIATVELPCDSELECPDGDGGVKKGTETEEGTPEPIGTPMILGIVLCTFIMPLVLFLTFWSMNCHEVQEKMVLRDEDEIERLNAMKPTFEPHHKKFNIHALI